MRQRDSAPASLSASAVSSTVIPSSVATAAAARAFETWCSPYRRSCTGAEPAGVLSVNDGRPVESRRTSCARTSASADSPKYTTRAFVREAIARTRRSSALRIATPSAGRASTSSPLASAIASWEPNSPTWAVPTLSTRPIRGGVIEVRYSMSPLCRAPISSTRCRVVSSTRRAVIGWPISLLSEPGG